MHTVPSMSQHTHTPTHDILRHVMYKLNTCLAAREVLSS